MIRVLLYGCKTWFITLTEGHKFRVSENRVLRGIFGPKSEEMAGGCRRLLNKELSTYASLNIIRISNQGG
jgi:hypothetical protein